MTVLVAASLTLTPAGCGGDDDAKRQDPFAAAKQRVLTLDPGRAAAPRWEPVARLEGTGDRTEGLEISSAAIQWRVRWRCSSGQITVSIAPRPRAAGARGEGKCPKRATTVSIQTGAVRLSVAATGRWSAVVEQQVDTALDERPLRAMRSPGARVLARGRFYAIQQNVKGQGEVRLYRLPTGRLGLRFEDFKTSANSDLFVWLSEAPRPRTTKQVVRARHKQIVLLKSTVGSQNYLLPPNVDARSIRSVVIWCEPIRIAYGGATLEPSSAAPSRP